ncbi:MAG: virulence RhuM family protein [Christensenellaceae bacterium]|jgi:hypothetical protein|nr:virulence RhuM family protein [Christensenellaceae bacterium]
MKKEDVNKKNEIVIRNSTAEFLIFVKQTGGDDGVEVRVQDGNVWLTQDLLAKLYDVQKADISKHLKNIFEDKELDETATVSKMETVGQEGSRTVTRNKMFYNLDGVIAVGYRVNSDRAIAFRQWATSVLKKYVVRGYVLDKKRLENGTFFGEDYFDHLLEEIREIRLSERRFWQKITDIYATAFDYNKDAKTTQDFFKKVQNKMEYAITKHTAPELIYNRADANKEHMGLTTWEQSPHGKIVKSDVTIAKNYLTQEELTSLELIVSGYLDFAEERARQHIPMDMESWAKHLDMALSLNNKNILAHAGMISRELADEKALGEFEKYRPIQDKLFESDYDQFIKQMEIAKKK